jgi:hypothetical protein
MTFKVQYAGVPESEREVRATSAEEAAFSYFRKEMYRNTVIVCVGLKDLTFSWKDFRDRIPNFDESRLIMLQPRRGPRRRRSVLSRLLDYYLKGEYRFWDGTRRR